MARGRDRGRSQGQEGAVGGVKGIMGWERERAEREDKEDDCAMRLLEAPSCKDLSQQN